MEFERGVKSSRPEGHRQDAPRPAPRSPSSPTRRSSRDVEFVHETLVNRLRELAFLNAGVEIVIEDERVGKRDDVQVREGPDRVRAVPQRGQERRCTPVI